MRNLVMAGLFATALAAVAAPAQAGKIVQPTGATTNVGTHPAFSLSNLFNQSGLSAGYTAGVTEFDTYIASNPTHSSLQTTVWVPLNNVTTGNVTFNLGASVAIESMAFWNRNNSSQGVRDFQLLACPDSACTSTTLVGNFTALANLGANDGAVEAQVFAFAATTTQYLRMDMLNTYGSPVLSAGEVVFEQAVFETPEPASALLLAGGLLALTARRRYGAG
jgi:hypothetical protein